MVVLSALDVGVEGLLNMIHDAFEDFHAVHLFNSVIRQFVKNYDVEPLFSCLYIGLFNSDIIQLDIGSLPKVFAGVQKVGELDDELN